MLACPTSPALHPTQRVARACLRVGYWHHALSADALGAGALGAVWQGAWADAFLLTHAQRLRPKLDRPFAVIDALCGAPQLQPRASDAPWWGDMRLIPCLAATSLGLGAKCICVCMATAASLGALGVHILRAAWAHLWALPDAPGWQVFWAHALGEGDAADLWQLATLWLGSGAARDAFGDAGQASLDAALFEQHAARIVALLTRLCQHPHAALRLWRWAQHCRALGGTAPQSALWPWLGQLGFSERLREALLRWSGDGLEALARLCARPGGAPSAELASLWDAVLHTLAPYCGGMAHNHAQAQLHDGLAAWLEAHATDDAWASWCAQGHVLLTQCKAELMHLTQQDGPSWPARLAALQAMCPPLVWTFVGRLAGVLATQPALVSPPRRVGDAVPQSDAAADEPFWPDAAWTHWASDKRAEPVWRGVAEFGDLLGQVEAVGRAWVAAMPYDAPDSPWRLAWAAARDAFKRHRPSTHTVHAAADAADEALERAPQPLDPYLQQSVQAKHGYRPPRAKARLGTLSWPDATTVVSKADVKAFYEALRHVHARQLGEAACDLQDASACSPTVEAAAGLLVALGQVLAVRTQSVPKQYCRTGRLNMRRYMQATLRPQHQLDTTPTYYDQRASRPVRSRALRFTILAPGKINFEHQSPWTLLNDVLDGRRRISAPWRDVASVFVVLESLFARCEAQWAGFPNLLEPLSRHLQWVERPQDTWDDACQNIAITQDAGHATSALATQMRQCVQQSRAKPPRDEIAWHKAPAHEVGVWLMTPEQAADVWAHEQRLMQSYPYFSAVGVVMGEADHLPAALRDAYVILPAPDADLSELAGRIERAFQHLQAADQAWDESCTRGG